MDIIQALQDDLIKTDAWMYRGYNIVSDVDFDKPVYEVDTCELNQRGIRLRTVVWTDKNGRAKSAEFTNEGIVFNR